MKLRPDQQRVASLLKETITLMCRNGLIFDSQFCIEATIGVTLDDKDVFVVSLNEVIGKDERSDVESNGGDPLPASPEKKPLAMKRGRPRKKTPKVTPKKAARKNKAEDSWGESADDFDDYASSDDASPPAKKSKDLLQEELNMTCDAGENVAVKQELQYDSSNVSRVPEEGEELLFSLEGQQSSELQLQQASNSMSESTSQVPSTSQQKRKSDLPLDATAAYKCYGCSKHIHTHQQYNAHAAVCDPMFDDISSDSMLLPPAVLQEEFAKSIDYRNLGVLLMGKLFTLEERLQCANVQGGRGRPCLEPDFKRINFILKMCIRLYNILPCQMDMVKKEIVLALDTANRNRRYQMRCKAAFLRSSTL